MKRIILVLGCHRSGTSLITRSLEALGVQLGTRLQPAAPDNPGGFYEDLDFQIVNNSILEASGAKWDTVGPIELKGLTASQLVRALLEDRTRRFPIFGVKDPRFCRTLPFWRKVLGDYAQVSCVYALRHPTEVAQSLAKRNGFNEAKGYAIWLVNTLEALTLADGAWSKVVVDYDFMVQEPVKQIARVSSALDLPVAAPFPLDAIRPDLRHHHYTDGGKPDQLIADVYDLLQKFARDEEHFASSAEIGKFFGWASQLERMAPILRALDDKAKPVIQGHRFGEFRWPA